MAETVRFRHCDFSHLLRLVVPSDPIPPYYGHVHEDEAMACALLVRDGWPDAGIVNPEDWK